jgi:predicted nucleotide-binding protein (sugar kinase/HSP70/actin superfamily)
MKIGIPRALFYWKRPYFWENFFENLEFEVLVSPKTNKEIVEIGTKIADPETCFSNKVFWGHLLWLDGKCDLIFVPRLKTNDEGLEYCPKFFGLPDLAKILVKTKILTETFDEKEEKFEKTLEKLGKKLDKNNVETEKAFEMALKREKERKEKEKREFFEKIQSKKRKVVLVSHPYNLYDTYVNLEIEKKLKNLGAEVIFIDEIPLTKCQMSNVKCQMSEWPEFHWEFGKEITEKIKVILEKFSEKIAGAIEISSFLCGCDAVLKEFIEKAFKKRKIPFLYLIIDEHTADAGLQTRVEAFMDTLK